ncbi:MAG TPA: tRNA-dihydrouridine synthase family protein, partial [Legionellaceae bacterium]|nr:tRNA-dihydrouridine synthase family protein [Legionellaceae bacterium]
MDINSSFQLGSLIIKNRLIQGPLAGFSCAPFRAQYAWFQAPGYCVSEMISAQDLLHRQPPRFVYRAPMESCLAYQLSRDDPDIMATAAQYLESIGADLIDINCGCPKAKIRKKGAGSALLTRPERLIAIITAIKTRIQIPLTVKIRLQHSD